MYLYVNIIAQPLPKVKQTSGAEHLKNRLGEPTFLLSEILVLLPYMSSRSDSAPFTHDSKFYLHFDKKQAYISSIHGAFIPCILLSPHIFPERVNYFYHTNRPNTLIIPPPFPFFAKTQFGILHKKMIIFSTHIQVAQISPKVRNNSIFIHLSSS